MACGVSNGHVTYDVTWPQKVKFVTPIRLERNISKTAGNRDSVPNKGPPIGNVIWGIKWSRYRWRHVTPEGAVRQSSMYMVGFLSDISLASCFLYLCNYHNYSIAAKITHVVHRCLCCYKPTVWTVSAAPLYTCSYSTSSSGQPRCLVHL